MFEIAVFHWQDNGKPAVKKLAYFIPLREWDWTIGVAIDFGNIEAESQRVLNNIVKLLEKTFSKIKIASTGYAFLFDGDGEILIAPPGLESADFVKTPNLNTGSLLTSDLKSAYNEKIDTGNLNMAWGSEGVNSWYKNSQGRVTQNWPGTLIEFWDQTRAPNPDDYTFT